MKESMNYLPESQTILSLNSFLEYIVSDSPSTTQLASTVFYFTQIEFWIYSVFNLRGYEILLRKRVGILGTQKNSVSTPKTFSSKVET